jgi:predicted dehydrogenase
LIRQGAIGKITQIQLDDGGNLLNTNSHNIRLALFLMDEPRAEWVMGAVERTTDVVERGLPAEDACLGVVGCSNGATILIQGNLVRGLGQGCRVIGTEGIMEFDTTHHPDDMIPSDAPMYMPEIPSARYNYEIGTVRYLNAATNGWQQVEAPWYDCWSHQCQEAIDWVEGRVTNPISGADRARAVQEIMMGLFESARKRQRIYLPLKTKVNPLKLMVDNGDLPVEWPGRYETRAKLVRGEGMSWHQNA